MPDDNDLDPEVQEQFESWFQKRQEAEEAKRNRNKQPKDFGEFLDRVADAVLDRAEARQAERRKAADDGEQEPGRGGDDGGGFAAGVRRFWGGESAAS